MTSTRSTRQRLAMCTIWPSVNDHDARRSSISVAAHPRNVISNVSGRTRGKWASPIALNRRMCLSMPMLIKAPRGMRCQRAMDTVCRPSGKLGNRDAVTVPRARKSASMISSLIVDDPGASVVPLPVSVHYEERRAHTAQHSHSHGHGHSHAHTTHTRAHLLSPPAPLGTRAIGDKLRCPGGEAWGTAWAASSSAKRQAAPRQAVAYAA